MNISPSSPPSIKDNRGQTQQAMSSVLFKAHCRNGGIRKRLHMPLAAPSTPPHRPDNAPPSIKALRKDLRKEAVARKQLQF